MMQMRSYRIAFFAAVLLHIAIALLLITESHTDQPVVSLATENEVSQSQPTELEPQQAKAIKAVSVDNQEVMKAVEHLKQERLHEQQVAENKQKMLLNQAEAARKQRIAEQEHLEKLKSEAAKVAQAREKQIAEEQVRLKQVAKQKQEEEKRLAEIKKEQLQLQKQQQEEAVKLSALKKKQAEELARLNKEQAAKVKAEKAEKADVEQKKQAAAAQQATIDAEKNARIAGEIDKYKALIISAISQQWILPENADAHMSSQFRIRLAPNGAVLEVSLTRSSGDSILDRSAQSAIYKASPLPVPKDLAAFDIFRDISLTVRPEKSRG